MRIVDSVSFLLAPGKGGNGVNSFFLGTRRSKVYDGGNGGKGGSVVLIKNPKLLALNHLLKTRKIKGIEGANGSNGNKNGLKGKSVFVEVPAETKLIIEGKEVEFEHTKVFEGGKGGLGSGSIKREVTVGGKGTRVPEIMIKLEVVVQSNWAILNNSRFDQVKNSMLFRQFFGIPRNTNHNEIELAEFLNETYQKVRVMFFPFYKEVFKKHLLQSKNLVVVGNDIPELGEYKRLDDLTHLSFLFGSKAKRPKPITDIEEDKANV